MRPFRCRGVTDCRGVRRDIPRIQTIQPQPALFRGQIERAPREIYVASRWPDLAQAAEPGDLRATRLVRRELEPEAPAVIERQCVRAGNTARARFRVETVGKRLAQGADAPARP